MSIKKSLSIGEFSPDLRWEKLKVKGSTELTNEELEFCIHYATARRLKVNLIYRKERVIRSYLENYKNTDWAIMV